VSEFHLVVETPQKQIWVGKPQHTWPTLMAVGLLEVSVMLRSTVCRIY